MAAGLLALVMPAMLYFAASWGLNLSSADPALHANRLSVARPVAAMAMALAAVGLLFVAPGLLGTLAFRGLARTRAMAHAWSLAANSAALIGVFLLLRWTCGVERYSLIVLWLLWTTILFVFACRAGSIIGRLQEASRRHGRGMLVGLIAVVVMIVAFFPEQFEQCLCEDGTETFELARSLRQHTLPYWELETWQLETWGPAPEGRMGTVVVNPSLINSYWTCALQTLVGDNELATRLPYWVWWSAIFGVMLRLITPPDQRGDWLSAVALALVMLLSCVLFTFYVGYNPYMADLANPGVVDALFTLLLLLSFDCLKHHDRAGWVMTVTLASLVLYCGALLFAATCIAAWLCQPIPRKEIVRWGLSGTGALAAVVCFYVVYGAVDGSLPYWFETIDIEYINDYLGGAPRWKSGPLFAGYFVLGCGGIPVLGLLAAWRRDAWQRTVAGATLIYLVVILGSGFKNLHYLGPLLPIPIVLFLIPKRPKGQTADRGRVLLAVASILICTGLCWPKARATFTLNRELGLNTTIATDDYLTAVRWARLRYAMREQGVISWDCDQHTWVAYAQKDAAPQNPGPLVLTDRDLPSTEYRLLMQDGSTADAIKLYTRDARWAQRLSSPRPLRPLDRYPWIFHPLADGPFSPHNNLLTDVQRIKRPW